MAASPSREVQEEAGSAPTPEADDPEGSMERDPQDNQHASFDFDVKEQDRWLPIANVARIMKQALPDNAKIAKEAKECMQECVSEFISFITSEASEKCQQEKRKTVNGEDILFAMTSLGFENYAEALKIYLTKYRETNQRNNAEGQRRGGSDEPQQYGGAGAASASSPPPHATSANAFPGSSNAGPPMNQQLDTDVQAFSDVYGAVTGNGDGAY